MTICEQAKIEMTLSSTLCPPCTAEALHTNSLDALVELLPSLENSIKVYRAYLKQRGKPEIVA